MLNDKEIKNKMMTPEKGAKIKAPEEPYFFPQYGITVDASSQKEAEEKLSVILAKKK